MPFKKKHRAAGKVGVFFADEGVALARVGGEHGERIEHLEFRPCAPAEQASVLAAAVKAAGMAGWPAVGVLAPAQYQLNQVEAPAVDPTELRAAIRWRIKEFLDYHIDDAVVDAFEVPTAAGRSGQRMMFALSARGKIVQSAVKAIEGSGLRVEAIDIPELAMRNLAAHVPDQGGGVAMVGLGDNSGLITVCRGETLYLARNLEFGSRQLIDSPTVTHENLTLEIQRSLDFYESQLAGEPASRILLAPMNADRDGILNHLNEQMGIAAFGLSLDQILEPEQELAGKLQARALLALGGALRHESVAL